MSKPKIAIIGGGPAGLSAAFHLTNDDNWQDKFESITVYQLGWRLGGKGATGRDPKMGYRIEEHGIHGFCNFYFNTWRMMEQVYAELSAADRLLLPVKTMKTAFLGSSLTLGVEHINGKWSSSRSHLPHFPGVPWRSGPFGDPSPLAIGRGLLEQMLRRGRAGPIDELDENDLVAPGDKTAATARTIHQGIEAALRSAVELSVDSPLAAVEALILAWTGLVQQILAPLGDLLAPAFETATRSGDLAAFSATTALDLYTTVLRGLIADGLLFPDRDLDDFDHEDYRAWLGRHHASQATLDSAAVKSVANMLFAYPHGDASAGAKPALSAASWLGWLLRSVTGCGEYFYLMAAGTGETSILPLYLALKARRVDFEFFHRLTAVGSALDGSERVVQTLTFEKQAEACPGTNYDPVARSANFGVWPNEPIWERLAGSKSARDFEAWEDPIRANTFDLTRGTGFHYVVWAIPPSMIPLVGDAMLQQRWLRVTQHTSVTATQAAQIWLTKDTKELGWPRTDPERYASASFPNPLNGMVGFDDLIRFEGWPAADRPHGLFYLCGPLAPKHPPGEASRPLEREDVRTAALETLRLLGHFLPGARPRPPDASHPGQIDFALLFSPAGSGHVGKQRILDQYVRANTRPTEAYVQAQAGSARGRLDAWDTDYANLVVAGDWIYTGINVGAFESAVTGGKLAAFALTGSPAIDAIEGYTFRHPGAATRAADALRSGRVPRIRP